jgi:hypothetical protein
VVVAPWLTHGVDVAKNAGKKNHETKILKDHKLGKVDLPNFANSKCTFAKQKKSQPPINANLNNGI